jgi:hypothetical protein
MTLPSWRNTDNIGESLKIEQLLSQLRKSEKEIIPYNKYVLINIGIHKKFIVNPLKPSERDIILSCETGRYRGWNMNKLKYGDIVIVNITHDISVEACLRLINYAVSHFDEIKKNQKIIISRAPRSWGLEEIGNITFPHYSRSPNQLLNSLPDSSIRRILSQDDTMVKNLVRQKYFISTSYRYPHKYGNLDCYTQNDSCFIYEKGKDSTVVFSSKQPVGFSSDKRNNFIAFTDDKHFYHIAMPWKKVSGPFTIPEPELFAIINYGILDDSLYTLKDTVIFTIHAQYATYEGARFKFHPSSGSVYIDSTSLSGDTERFMQEQKEIREQKLAAVKEAEAFSMRKYYTLILVCFVISLNLFLAFSKKL